MQIIHKLCAARACGWSDESIIKRMVHKNFLLEPAIALWDGALQPKRLRRQPQIKRRPLKQPIGIIQTDFTIIFGYIY